MRVLLSFTALLAAALLAKNSIAEGTVRRVDKTSDENVPLNDMMIAIADSLESTTEEEFGRELAKKKKKNKKKKTSGGCSGVRLLFFGKKSKFCMRANSINIGSNIYTAKCKSESKQKFKKDGGKLRIGNLCVGYEGMWLKIKSCTSINTDWSWSGDGEIKAGSQCVTQRHEPGNNERIKRQDFSTAKRHGTNEWEEC